MTSDTKSNVDWVSALHDDALEAWPEGESLDDGAVQKWQETVHVAQAMRNESWGEAGAQQRLLSAMQAAYKDVELNRPEASGETPSLQVSTDIRPAQQEAANERVFAWPWAAALVLAVGAWMVWPQLTSKDAVLAQADATPTMVAQNAPVLIEQNGVIRDPRLDALLQSHRQSGAGSALQYPAGFVRSVALER